MNSNQNNNEQSKEQQEQHNVDSNQRLAQTAVKGGATAAGAALGGAVGAKIGSKVGDAVNNSKVGQGLTRGVGNAMNTMNKFNPAGKMTQNATNKLADSGAMDLADKGIDMAANAAGGTGGQSPQVNNVPTQNVNPSASSNPNTFNQNPVSTSPEPQATKAPNPSEQSQININKENYNPWRNSKNPSKNRTPISSQTNGNQQGIEESVNQSTSDNSSATNDIADNILEDIADNDQNNENESVDSKQSTSQKVRNKVMQSAIIKMVIAASLSIGALLLFLLPVLVIIFIIVSATSGLANKENGEVCVNTPQCDTVIIEDGLSAGTYTLDEYLVGAVNNYFREYDGNNVYAAATVIVHKDLMYNAKIDPTNKACTLTKNNHYIELKTIDMSSATDDSSVPDSSSDEEQKISDTLDETDKKIVTAASAYKNKTIIMYNNISFDEADKSILSGQNANYQKVIKEFLKIEDDSFEVVKICGMDKDQVVNYCNKVAITNGDDAGEYDFEDYIAGVVNAEVSILRNEEVYKAFAVAARNYLLTHSTENNGVCSIEDSKDFQTFTPTTNQKIIDAVNATKGEFLYKDGKLVSTQYDAFCWYEKDNNYYTLKQQNQKIPVDWVEENVDIAYRSYKCATGSNHGHGNGMSQYGSKYLATIKNFNYEQILTYYYRGNISSGNTGGDSGSGGNSTPEIISGVTANAAGFVMPLQSYSYVSCEFGAPPGIGYKPHRGTDFAAAGGTPILAVHDGTITNRQYHNSWGNYIKIQNSDGTATLYAHMSAFKEGLSVGSAVKAGQVIGYVGSTGDSTGNHLHLEMYNTSGQLVNPRSYLSF